MDKKSGTDDLLQRILSELIEINSNLLMSESQRQVKSMRRGEQFAEQLVTDFNQALASNDFARCQRLIERFEAELPDDKRCVSMRQCLSETQEETEQQEVELETRRVEDMMSVSAFDDAQKVATALVERYPQSELAIALLEKVRREGETFYKDQRRRLYKQVQRRADSRKWKQALEAAKRLVSEHPGTTESDAAGAMMSTLEDNANLEEVRILRDRIRDMIRRRRYSEALELAGDVLERFPDTQAAADLRGQINRLKELARKDGEQRR